MVYVEKMEEIRTRACTRLMNSVGIGWSFLQFLMRAEEGGWVVWLLADLFDQGASCIAIRELRIILSFKTFARTAEPFFSLTPLFTPCHGNPMSGTRIAIDGLWRCLCPSVNAAILTRAISVPYRPRLARRCPAKRTTCAGPRANRALHTTRPKLESAADIYPLSTSTPSDAPPLEIQDIDTKENGNQDSALEKPETEEGEGQQDRPLDTNEVEDGPGGLERQEEPERTEAAPAAEEPRPLPPWQAWRETMLSPRARGTIVERILETKPPYDRFPSEMTATDVIEALRVSRSKGKPRWRRLTTALVKHLLNDGTAPNTFIYETLLNTHALPEGSATVVKGLLEEMRAKKVRWSQYAYHSAIRVCSPVPGSNLSCY